MSIIIPGMKMPTACIYCPFMVSRDGDDCILQSEEANARFETWEQMKADCPIIELPPHGRLIDADALKIYQMEENVRADGDPNEYEYDAGLIDGLHIAAKDVSVAPTVIPAEEE